MRELKTFWSESPDDTQRFAAELAEIFRPGDVVLLEGDLGSGKTFLVKALCRIWQTDDPAVSPSFAILHSYQGEIPVNHFDFYRIHNPLELDNLGWEEQLRSPAISFIEWPQLVENRIKDFYKIQIKFEDHKRRFTLFKTE